MPRVPCVPVLAYHAIQVNGPGYADNDHVGFARDLECVHALGLRIVSLRQVAQAVVAGKLDQLRGCVALSFDDGADFDAFDVPHPTWGVQPGMATILRRFRARHGAGAQPELHATAFVIVSPEARKALDAACLIGCRWWNDDWWAQAEAGGLLAVESHSWDHNHAALDSTQARAPQGAFELTEREDADREIARASLYLRERRGRGGDVLFAYPYGPASDYLAERYFPDGRAGHGVFAAFTTDPRPVSPGDSRWKLPRYVFGRDWKTAQDLESLLTEACALPRRSGLFGKFGTGWRARRVAPPPAVAALPGSWRDHLRSWETNDARAVAGELFRRSFGHEIPRYPRHFVLVYSPPDDEPEPEARVVAYVHQTPFEDVHLCGGMCADAGAYRAFPKWLFEAVKQEGGLATIVTRDSIALLGEGVAVFGHVGEPRARAADLRTGFIDTDRRHLMVIWRGELPEAEREARIARVEAQGPF